MASADGVVMMVASANVIEQAIPDANVGVQLEEEYDEVRQHTIAKMEAKFTLIFGADWK
jgi:hypothetical protein